MFSMIQSRFNIELYLDFRIKHQLFLSVIEKRMTWSYTSKDMGMQVVLDTILLVHENKSFMGDEVKEKFSSIEKECHILSCLRPSDEKGVISHLWNKVQQTRFTKTKGHPQPVFKLCKPHMLSFFSLLFETCYFTNMNLVKTLN